MTLENKNMLNLLADAVEMAAVISENISVNDIAFSGGMCCSKCSRLFHQMIGQAPNAYLTHYRIARSCKLLNETNMSISETADACGFWSASYFIAVFKKAIGISPQKYRKNSL